MHFNEIVLRNFGSFEDLTVSFRPGLNVIEGQNATGKTQIVGAIIAAIVGKSALSIDEQGSGPSSLALALRGDKIRETVDLTVSIDSQGRPIVDQKTSAEKANSREAFPSSEILLALSDPAGPQPLLNYDSQPRFLDIGGAEDLLPAELKEGELGRDFRNLIETRQGGSGRLRTLRVLFEEYITRRRRRAKLPLIVDDFLYELEYQEPGSPIKLLASLAETNQVIIATSTRLFANENVVAMLGPRFDKPSTLAYFNSSFARQRPRFTATSNDRWIKGQVFAKQEDRSCELKEVKGENPLASIKAVVDQYVVAFLNAGVPQEGAIFWGIRNEDRVITGVNLSDQGCDELRRIVTEKLHQITPPLAPTRYQINLHPLSDGVTVIDDLYVLEVRVPSVRKSLLFATGSQEVYVKTDSGKKRLTALEMQHELLHRLGIDDRS